MFEPIEGKETTTTDYRTSKMRSEKEKLERALERLEDLYLFDDHSMSEKNYLIKRKSIKDKLKEVDSNMEKEIKTDNASLQQYDLNFIRTTTQYLLSENIDKNLMKEFINSVVKKINMDEDRKIHSIEFVNGMEYVFVHRIDFSMLFLSLSDEHLDNRNWLCNISFYILFIPIIVRYLA